MIPLTCPIALLTQTKLNEIIQDKEPTIISYTMGKLSRKRKRLLACSLGTVLLIHHFEQTKRHRKRRWWVRPWSSQNRRRAQGFASNLVQELRNTDHESFKNFFR